MSFTYDLSTDIGKMRFHLRDTTEAAAKFSDEELSFAATEAGSWQAGCILAIDVLIADLAQPDYRADWLQESNHAAAAKTLMLLQNNLRRRFGVSKITASTTHTYRADSLTTEEPDYSEGA